jgi:hypothetical protein
MLICCLADWQWNDASQPGTRPSLTTSAKPSTQSTTAANFRIMMAQLGPAGAQEEVLDGKPGTDDRYVHAHTHVNGLYERPVWRALFLVVGN